MFYVFKKALPLHYARYFKTNLRFFFSFDSSNKNKSKRLYQNSIDLGIYFLSYINRVVIHQF